MEVVVCIRQAKKKKREQTREYGKHAPPPREQTRECHHHMHRNHHNKPKNKNTSNQIVHAKNRVLTLRKLMHEQKHGNMLRIFSTYIIELKQCSAKTIHIISTHDHNDKSCGCHYSQYPHHKSCVFNTNPDIVLA